MAGILRGIGSRYMSLLKKHPMKVQSISTGKLTVKAFTKSNIYCQLSRGP